MTSGLNEIGTMARQEPESTPALSGNDQGAVAVDLMRAIGALHRMRTTVGLLGQAVVQQEAASAQRRTLSLLESTRASKRQRLDDSDAASTNVAKTITTSSSGGEDHSDDQWMTIMTQTIRAERIADILRDLDELQEKFIFEMEACAVDRLESSTDP